MRKGIIMKTLLYFCLLITSLGMSAQGKKVTLSLKDVPLTSALRQVEQQSDYYKVNYPSSEISRYKVTTNVKNVSAPDAVKELLRGLPFTSSVNGQFIQIKKTNPQETSSSRKAVHGRILDSNGDPLIGATVLAEGTGKGTVTDIDGNFRLEDVEEDVYLTYSYIGKQSLKRKASYKSVVIILEDEDATQIDEVVVTGVVDRKASSYTGSVTSIKGDELRRMGNQNVFQSLKNLDASVTIGDNFDMGSNPNSLPDMTMRGGTSFPS